MALDRIYTLHAAGETDPAPTDIWAGTASNTGLVGVAGVALVAGAEVDTELSAVLRTRWRGDISLRSLLTDDRQRTWVVQELEEVGRRKWLDISVALPSETIITPQTPDPGSGGGGFVAPTGWGLQLDGSPVRTLVVAEVDSDTSFQFTNPGASGRLEVGTYGIDTSPAYTISELALRVVDYDAVVLSAHDLIPVDLTEGLLYIVDPDSPNIALRPFIGEVYVLDSA